MECGRSRETAKRSDLAGWAEYGYCASHSRYFCGLRLHLVTTLAGSAGLPVAFALAEAEVDERAVPLAIFTADPDLTTSRPGQALPGGPPPRRAPRAAAHLFKPPRQIIESVNDTLKGQLDLERHGAHTPSGVITRILQRILARPPPSGTTTPPARRSASRERAIPRANAGHPQTTSADAARSDCLRSSSAQ